MKPIVLLVLVNCFSGINAQNFNTVTRLWEADPAFKNASIGFCVMDAATGSVIAEYNSGKSLTAASTMKVFSTAAALKQLGNSFRFSTTIGFTGTFNKTTGEITGDLVIKGSGDPSLGSEYFTKNANQEIAGWVQAIKNAGVKSVRGDIIGDGSAFERTIPDHWIWSDISNYFGAIPNGLSVLDNKYTLTYKTGKAGSTATLLAVSPPEVAASLSVTSNVKSQGSVDAAWIYGDPFGNRKEVRGTLPPDRDKFDIEGALPDPAAVCAAILRRALIAEGIIVKGAARSDYENSVTATGFLHTLHSPTLEELVHFTNLRSNNHYCESLVMALGKGSAAEGLAAVKQFWHTQFVDTSEIYMVDGSGLSRANTTTPRAQTRTLCRIYTDTAIYRVINHSLPLAGRENSLRSFGAPGRLRCKTGYVSRARAYCGYLRRKGGKDVAFALIINNYNCAPGTAREKLAPFFAAMDGD